VVARARAATTGEDADFAGDAGASRARRLALRPNSKRSACAAEDEMRGRLGKAVVVCDPSSEPVPGRTRIDADVRSTAVVVAPRSSPRRTVVVCGVTGTPRGYPARPTLDADADGGGA
jgi:hypothetical protein